MDPISMGATAIGTTILMQFTNKLAEKASDPKTIEAGVQWLFTAIDNFKKIRRKESDPEAAIPAPTALASSGTESATSAEVRVREMNDFMMNQLEQEVDHQLNLLDQHLTNYRIEVSKAEQYGSADTPMHLVNSIREQERKVSDDLKTLNRLMETAYGVSTPGIDELAKIVTTQT